MLQYSYDINYPIYSQIVPNWSANTKDGSSKNWNQVLLNDYLAHICSEVVLSVFWPCCLWDFLGTSAQSLIHLHIFQGGLYYFMQKGLHHIRIHINWFPMSIMMQNSCGPCSLLFKEQYSVVFQSSYMFYVWLIFPWLILLKQGLSVLDNLRNQPWSSMVWYL